MGAKWPAAGGFPLSGNPPRRTLAQREDYVSMRIAVAMIQYNCGLR
jgi:hypothetical protein